jgi:hypothetical protein
LPVAYALQAAARSLVYLTQAIPDPLDSRELIGVLADVQHSLAQVYGQLVRGHVILPGVTRDGGDGNPGDDRSNGANAAIETALALRSSARFAHKAGGSLAEAHSINCDDRRRNSPF